MRRPKVLNSRSLSLLVFACFVPLFPGVSTDSNSMVHLSITASGQLLVSWSVSSVSAKSQALLRYAPVGTSLDNGFISRASRISSWRGQLLVSAEIGNATEGAAYTYQCSDDLGTLWGPAFQLNIPPGAIAWPASAPVSPPPLARMVVLGELDVDDDNGPVVVQGLSHGPPSNLALHLGGIGLTITDAAAMKAERFLNMIQPIASRIPYMTVPGSHDAPNVYTSLFHMPAVAGDLWYTFALGCARVIMLWTEALVINRTRSDIHNKAVKRQTSWLRKQLELSAPGTSERLRRPWLIVAGQQPSYCSMSHDVCGEGAAKLRAVIEPLLHNYSVDLYLSARLHAYERSHPVYDNSKCNNEHEKVGWFRSPCAPIYVTNGDAGFPSLRYDSVPAHWTAQRHPGIAGYGELTVHNATHLQYRQLAAATQAVRDEFWITKLETGSKIAQEDDFFEAVFWLGFALSVIIFTCGFVRWVHGDGIKRRDESPRNLRTDLAVSGDAPRVIGTTQENESLVQPGSQCSVDLSPNDVVHQPFQAEADTDID